MSFLPIVGRELRGASRRRGTYWVRTAVAGIAVLTGSVIFIANLGAATSQSGRAIFQGLSGLVLLYCLISGRRSTVDCLSVEKREGTLGLLFLTDLKGYDVVLGKLVATSLNGFYGLLAVMPVLALSILLGGVSYGEFWRMTLVLGDTFLFSLAIGIFCSALSRDARRAMSANFALLLFFVGVLPAFMGIIKYLSPSFPFVPQLFYTCPGYSFYLSLDPNYRLNQEHFWWSTGIIHALTWLLVILTSLIIPRTWQDKQARAAKSFWRGLWQAWNFGPAAGRAPYRQRSLNVNAFYWLAGRVRFKPVHAWVFVGMMAGWWVWGRVTMGEVWFDGATVVVMGLILNSTFKLWATLEAAQQLGEDQRMGTLELLLPTPLGVRDIVRGQWLALRRQFLTPVMAVIAGEFILMLLSLEHRAGGRELFWTVAAGTLMLVLDMWALSWVGMRQALTAKTVTRGLVGAVARVLLLPWAVFGMVQLVVSLHNLVWFDNRWVMGWRAALALWFGLGLAADLIFGLIARTELLTSFHRLAMHRFHPQPSRLARWFGSSDAATSNASSTEIPAIRVKWWRRKAVSFPLVLILVLAGGFVLMQRKSEFKPPPPVLVSITQNNTPLQILPGGRTTLMVLPDGSLWRWGWDHAGPPTTNLPPTQIGTGRNWTFATGDWWGGLAVQRDGTLWGWGQVGVLRWTMNVGADPVQIDSASNWVSAASSASHSLALKRDGSLWGWGNNRVAQLGNGPGPNQTNLVQVGTNRDWAEIRVGGSFSIGIRTDGTLWGWGQMFSITGGMARAIQVPVPMQMTSDTNWVRLETLAGTALKAWNTAGELWELPTSPIPTASVTNNGILVLAHSQPGHFASAVVASALRNYELRTDGSLWDDGVLGSAAAQARQVGERSDWISIWGSNPGAALGLTADGTIWTWGMDYSRKAEIPFSERLKELQRGIQQLFGRSPGPNAGSVSIQPYNEKPRPLIHMIFNATNTGDSRTNK